MVSPELQKKIDRAIRLLQITAPDDGSPVEVCYSGGKDSDVILQLAKESGINYRAIYKNTTIDPPGTIAHAKAMGAEVWKPRNGMTFFKLIEKNGFPTRFYRHCCSYLKEYKILDKAIVGVRKEESIKRSKMYNEPTQCRFYGSKKEHVEQIMPILDWTLQDVAGFITDRNITCAPVYYNGGIFDASKRLGCMCCPLQSRKNRIESFKEHPIMVRRYIAAIIKFRESHTNAKCNKYFQTAYEQFYFYVFFERMEQFNEFTNGLFGRPDCKKLLEEYFNVELP